MRRLVFIHGRAQERKDPVALKKEWIMSWAHGLAKSGLQIPLAEHQIRFPYYGDTLDQLTQGIDESIAARVIVRGTKLGDAPITNEEQEFIRDYLFAVKKKCGISDDTVRDLSSPDVQERGILNWRWVQGILEALDRNVPGASAASVALFTTDVFQYLNNGRISTVINQGVKQALSEAPDSIVVSHSLGTVVAYRLLTEAHDAGWSVPLLVTLGSPLGVEVVRKKLSPIEAPAVVGRWFNAMDNRDVVALWPLDKDNFDVDPPIENKTDVDNPTKNRHGISGYLGDPEVARRIYDAIMA